MRGGEECLAIPEPDASRLGAGAARGGMAPAASRLWAEAGLGALPRRALAQYLHLLQLYPVLTKAATRSARGGRSRAGGGGDP